MTGICLWIVGGQTKKKYILRYKSELITELLKEEFDEVVFEPPILMKIDLIRVRKQLEVGVQDIKRYIEVLELYKKSYVS